MAGQTVVEKIAGAHRPAGATEGLVRAGDFVSIRPRHVMTHDNTAPVMKKFASIGASRIHDPRQPVFTIDHDVQNRSEENLAKYASIERFADEHGVDFHAAGEGIGHQLMVERGYVAPGSFVVASDSHSNIYGALGAIGTPVVRTDAAAIWATGEFWWQVPRTISVVLEGELREGVTGKDLIITLCGMYDQGEALNAAIEFSGPGVASLDMDARLTISNMTTEWGALVGWFPADEVTAAFLRERSEALAAMGIHRLPAGEGDALVANAPVPDPDARYAARITLDLSQVTPHVAGPDIVQKMTSVHEMQERGVEIHKAYLVSCTNARFEDLAAAARVLRGQRIAEGAELYVAAASREVQRRAEEAGHWQVILAAGATALPASCGPCIGLGTGLLEPGEVGISATNRNFKGRMGSRDAKCYLASPVVVAASAIAGRIAAPGVWSAEPPERRHEVFSPKASPDEGAAAVEIQDGFPERVTGRLVLVPADNVNTDGIYGKDYTYRDDMTTADMARVAMENYDPEFATLVNEGDVVVAGWNFGTGSSREQAVTCLQAKGIPMVVAGSYSQTYLRNAFNNGFLCLQSPELVEHLRQSHADRVSAGAKTVVPGTKLEVDFTTGTIRCEDRTFRFPAMSEVPQSLFLAGGIENLVRRRLGISNQR